jgi:hypothetical protein
MKSDPDLADLRIHMPVPEAYMLTAEDNSVIDQMKSREAGGGGQEVAGGGGQSGSCWWWWSGSCWWWWWSRSYWHVNPQISQVRVTLHFSPCFLKKKSNKMLIKEKYNFKI